VFGDSSPGGVNSQRMIVQVANFDRFGGRFRDLQIFLEAL
jgi:hypothetical protein